MGVNVTLMSRMAELRLTQEEFAARMNDALAKITGQARGRLRPHRPQPAERKHEAPHWAYVRRSGDGFRLPC